MIRKFMGIALGLFLVGVQAGAQLQTVTVADLYQKGTFRVATVRNLVSMNDGVHYTRLEGGTQIIQYQYATGDKVKTLLDLAQLEHQTIQKIEGYELSPDESKILLYTNSRSIYRHSFVADYYLYDFRSRELIPLSEKGAQQFASFSPNGTMVAFVRDNNLFVRKLLYNTESQITTDGATNRILNGAADWVYEEEFGLTRAFEWSADSEELAYIRFDESEVREFSFPMFRASNPEEEAFALYPGNFIYKYPKAGEANSKASVHVFHIRNRTTKTANAGGEECYLPRIQWTTEPGKLAVFKLNRRQNELSVWLTNTASTLSTELISWRNSSYIDPDILDNFGFLPDGKHFVALAEEDGYSHLHLYAQSGIKVRQLTRGNFDVTAYYGYDADRKLFYCQAAGVSPLERHVYAVSFDGKKNVLLTEGKGTHRVDFGTGFKFGMHTHSSAQMPPVTRVIATGGKPVRVVEENLKLKEKLGQYSISPKEFFSFSTSGGVQLNGWMVKPAQFDASQKYPVLMVQYSGPNSQQVTDQWRLDWEQVLAAEGYVVVCIDPRGTGARGENFRKCTYQKLGLYESDDQIAGAHYLAGLPFVDGKRIGIWGWSYGGFMSALCLSRSDVFKCGIAVAPVTSWRFYDTVYTERYMRKPDENSSGYDLYSPLNLADQVKGRLFLIHGSADDNVHYQNQMEYADRLVQAGVQFDMFTYPNRNHGIYGGNVRNHLYTMMVEYLKRNL